MNIYICLKPQENQGQISFLQFHESVKWLGKDLKACMSLPRKVRGVPTAFDMKVPRPERLEPCA